MEYIRCVLVSIARLEHVIAHTRVWLLSNPDFAVLRNTLVSEVMRKRRVRRQHGGAELSTRAPREASVQETSGKKSRDERRR